MELRKGKIAIIAVTLRSGKILDFDGRLLPTMTSSISTWSGAGSGSRKCIPARREFVWPLVFDLSTSFFDHLHLTNYRYIFITMTTSRKRDCIRMRFQFIRGRNSIGQRGQREDPRQWFRCCGRVLLSDVYVRDGCEKIISLSKGWYLRLRSTMA